MCSTMDTKSHSKTCFQGLLFFDIVSSFLFHRFWDSANLDIRAGASTGRKSSKNNFPKGDRSINKHFPKSIPKNTRTTDRTYVEHTHRRAPKMEPWSYCFHLFEASAGGKSRTVAGRRGCAIRYSHILIFSHSNILTF